jgi:predicted permease
MAIEERIAQGQPRDEARAAAMKEFGNLALVEDVTREQWGWLWLDHLAQDLRYAVLKLRKSPGYTWTAILTLTLVIGANTAIFGLIYAVMLRRLPVERPDRLVQIKLQLSGGENGAINEPTEMVSGKLYDVVAGNQWVFSGMCAWSSWPLNLRDSEGTRPVDNAMVTGDCFRMLGVHAALGRLFTLGEDKPGGGPEGYPIVLGYDYWRTRMGADPAIVGRVLDFEGKKGVVVGVMERGFGGVQVGASPSIYVPSEMGDPVERHSFGSFNRLLLARLNDGVTPAQAQAQIDPAFNAWIDVNDPEFRTKGYGGGWKQQHLLVFPGRTGSSYLRTRYDKPLFLLEGLVGLSLLVACAYLAMLSSTRALARRRELALRIALGGSRSRVVGELCYESLLVALAGSALGVLFAWTASHLLLRLLPMWGSQSLKLDTAPGTAVLLFTLGLSVVTVLLSGLGPALRASRLNPAKDMKEGEQSLLGRRRRLGAWLAPLQVAFSLVIVVAATLMATSLAKLLAVDPGFNAKGVTFLTADFTHRSETDKTPLMPLQSALLDRIRHAPGVEAASLSQTHALSGGAYMTSAASALPSGETRKDENLLELNVAPDYFRTLGIPLLAGKDFAAPAFAAPAEDLSTKAAPTKKSPGKAASGENASTPEICILNRSAAEFFFPGGHALGGILTLPGQRRPDQVIAVVGNTQYFDLRETPPHMIYVPYLNGVSWNPFTEFAVRAKDPAMAITAVREAFRQLAPDVAVTEPVTMAKEISNSTSRERLLATLASFLALLALALTAIGIYGLLNDSVTRRRSEIGLRIALGASTGAVARLVLREAMRIVLPGLALGLAGAWAATRLAKSFLYGVRPLDPWAFGASVALLAIVAVTASLLPAWRAASVDPMEALRSE